MSALRRFESKLEQMISGAFARTFKSEVQPVEITAALNKELDNSAQILSRDRRIVPNSFEVELSDTDYDRLEGLGSGLTKELVEMVREHAASQGYVFAGPVQIELVADDALTTGRFRVHSKAQSKVQPAGGDPTATSVTRAKAALEVNGRKVPLFPPGIVIGRSNDADLRVDDPGVSRRHAEVRVTDHGFGARVSVHDLGSTNGISVDGRKVETATLVDGASLRIGNTTMTLHLSDGGD